MTNKERLIAAFLVSMGLFSSVQAMQYVKTLSLDEKKALAVVANLSNAGDVICVEEKQRTELQNTNA
jgi:hypothetical protein